jgi:membrane protein YdbS with pleckstrin-like domain
MAEAGPAGRPHPADDRSPSSGRIHGGIWGILEALFLVPRDAPETPPGRARWTRSFRPDPAFLTYLTVVSALRGGAFVVLAFGFGALIVLSTEGHWAALAGGSLLVALVTVLVVFDLLTVRLRYDATWYVMTDRALRNRRGIWTIRENTVSFDNIQNLKVQEGPIQRRLGIQNLLLETAAAGSAPADDGAQAQQLVVEGIADARELRDRIAERMRSSGSGLGGRPRRVAEDEGAARPAWTPAHLTLLRGILDEVRRLEPAEPQP